MPNLSRNPNQLLGLPTEGRAARAMGKVATGFIDAVSTRKVREVRLEGRGHIPRARFEAVVQAMAEKPLLADEEGSYKATYAPSGKRHPLLEVDFHADKDSLVLRAANEEVDHPALRVKIQVGRKDAVAVQENGQTGAVRPSEAFVVAEDGSEQAFDDYPQVDQQDLYRFTTDALALVHAGISTGETVKKQLEGTFA